ncbi:spermidine/putrescine import ATP-binding protein PotA [Spirochaetia bacterium]|nr:spermidine/putrescine import ATP-binding protein PotA [Spirochaetia bacterium]
MEPLLKLKGINKSFGTTRVLNGIDLDLARGEFFTLLGPSGCGKTTTLRIIAGLETLDEGTVFLNGKDITALEPNKRNVNTVFQNYALFPYYDVYKNVAYGLKIRKTPKDEVDTRVREALALVQMEQYLNRMPNELSGGQRQRVAMARALVNHPDVLLLDEPLGALDLKLRKQMQIQLKRLQQNLGIAFVYVTHDQEEALNMSDRIGVMNNGYFEQISTPQNLYQKPRTQFVADFIGETNFVQATVLHTVDSKKNCVVQLPFGQTEAVAETEVAENLQFLISIRPEHIQLRDAEGDSSAGGFRAIVEDSRFKGAVVQTLLKMSDGSVLSSIEITRRGEAYPTGREVEVFWKPEHAVVVKEDEAQA